MEVRITPIRAWTMLGILSVGIMLFAFLWDLTAEKPVPGQATVVEMERNRLLEREVLTLRRQEEEAAQEYRKLLWTGPLDDIAPAALARIDHLAKVNGVRRIAFRPQRSETEAGLVKIPYALALEGSYPRILDFLRDLETPSNKLAVSQVQLASTDASADTVNATIGVVAFQEEVKAEAKNNGNK